MNTIETVEAILSGQLRRMPNTLFEQFCARKRVEYGQKFVRPSAVQFIDAYNNGGYYRVKVRTTYTTEIRERWGYVSLTTGWAPAFLLMHHFGQQGSSDVLNERDEIIDSHWHRQPLATKG